MEERKSEEGSEEEGLEEGSGGGRRGWVIACLPVLPSLRARERVLVGVTLLEECVSVGRGVSVSVSGVWALLVPPTSPLYVLGSAALGTPSCALR